MSLLKRLTLSALTFALPLSLATPAQAASSTAVGTPERVVTSYGHSSRPPNYIASYSQHAQDRMRERNISRDEVEGAVAHPKSFHWQKKQNNWWIMSQNGHLAVIIDDNANVVTVMRILW
ncbi:DUF4258 domain-containing protein [Corynebacterium sp. p3-SID1194]|uniref:DUF4258 domain-containing protein n=1 Tax=Corynebacterium sp. p3-SID1194 TaxID=2916105 RepID=UPI0021A69B00|nr:DUF4258 domain-containing protein [Corynebacterium sp. p3-SID1194]MCT1450079.1 DUF4258 domain-containing protein [Corynebacterium sp. p3-SID1194]